MHFLFSLPRKKPVMSITRVFRKSPGALAVTCLALFTTSVRAQAPQPPPTSLEREVQEMRIENNAIREHLGKLEKQQKTILQLIDKLQRKLDGRPAAVAQQSAPALQPEPVLVDRGTAPDVSIPGKTIVPSTTAHASAPAENAALNTPPAVTGSVSTSIKPASVASPQTNDVRYRDGIVIWETPENAKVPFLLKFNVNTQIRYLNTLDSNQTFTDHLGVVRDVHTRNDITVNRAMFILGGYIFDKRLRYSFTVWTSAGAASIVVASNIGWQFSKAITITGGYTGVPGSRSLVNTFPFFTATDRSMADNFFRPGFTQGIWANGEPVKGLNYLMFVGNGLNTLNISANKIDTHLMFSGSVWWEPLGPYGEPGKSRNMYDDYFASKNVRIRIGTAFTQSREDRFSNLDQSSPENTSLYNSDGVLTFSTGAFAPGVTVDKATYKMLAADAGIKWNGLAVNGQYFLRWLGNFAADGPLPLKSTFDRGGELSAGYFVKPKTLMPYIRGSWVRGQFGNSYEYGGGVKWYFLPTERLWLSAEVFRINKAPYTGAFTPYTAGMTGWVPMLQAILAF
jgi:hypothetical protein